MVMRDASRPLREPRVGGEVRIQRCSAAEGDSWESLVPPHRRGNVQTFLARGDAGYLAGVDGRLAGWIWLSRVTHRDPWSGLRIRLGPDEAYAYALWVDPEHRPKGVAAALVVSLLREVRDDPTLTRVYGWVDKRNRESQVLLRLLGFVQVQHVKRVHVLHRIGRQLPRSDRPRFGPLSAAGRHRST